MEVSANSRNIPRFWLCLACANCIWGKGSLDCGLAGVQQGECILPQYSANSVTNGRQPSKIEILRRKVDDERRSRKLASLVRLPPESEQMKREPTSSTAVRRSSPQGSANLRNFSHLFEMPIDLLVMNGSEWCFGIFGSDARIFQQSCGMAEIIVQWWLCIRSHLWMASLASFLTQCPSIFRNFPHSVASGIPEFLVISSACFRKFPQPRTPIFPYNWRFFGLSLNI